MLRARTLIAAAALVAGVGTTVLAGWLFDVTSAKSVMAGWRVMVPVTAACFVLQGVTIFLAAGHPRRRSKLIAARAAAVIALALPLLTFVEYLTGIRTGLEGWFGIAFDGASAVAGRMSPLTSLCLSVLSVSLIAATFPGHRAAVTARIAAGSTLLTAWLAIIAVALTPTGSPTCRVSPAWRC
jgi:hypothetical protein